MDKKTQNLDPALKATYERVMGTTVNPQAQPASPTVSAPSPNPTVSAPVAPQVTAQPPKVVGGKNADATKIVAGGGKGGGLSPILVAVALILFFAIYTFVWLFVFKVKLPFLPF